MKKYPKKVMEEESEKESQILLNRRVRRVMRSRNRRNGQRKVSQGYNDKQPRNRQETASTINYTDSSYIDKTKKVFQKGVEAVKARVREQNKKYSLPKSVAMERTKLLTSVVILNKDGRKHAFLPDDAGCHKILCHGNIAKAMVSKVCMLVRITDNYDESGKWIDGSWAITPAEYRMMRVTTIQHVRRRKFFFLRRYWYEISFDGKVQPAHLLFDYDMNPEAKKTKLWITREYVKVRGKELKFNDYFRFWREKPVVEKGKN